MVAQDVGSPVSWATMAARPSQTLLRDTRPFLNSQTCNMRTSTGLPFPVMPRISPGTLPCHWCSRARKSRRTSVVEFSDVTGAVGGQVGRR